MDPSSLIFVVIVGIWAVYLLGHWVRRRDLLATARSVDRFSEAMRVLERRPPQPVRSPRSHSYVVSPARLPAQGGSLARSASGPVSGTAQRRATLAATIASRRAAVRSDVGASGRAETLSAPGARGSRVAPPTPRPDAAANRARAVVLLALLGLTPLTWLLASFTALPAWLPLVLTVALAAHVVRLRRAAMRRRQAARRPARAAARGGSAESRPPSARPTTRPARRPSGPRTAAPARAGLDEAAPGDDSHRAPVDETAPEGDSLRAPLDESASGDHSDGAPLDETARTEGATTALDATAAAKAADATATEATAVDGTPTAVAAGWQPVPVPPPTYTLKPKAPAPVRRPLATPARAADEQALPATSAKGAANAPTAGFDLDAILERRIAAGG